MRKKILPSHIVKMKRRGEKIVMITAYDYPTAKLVDEAGVDAILVGDSLGMVVLGYSSTLPVTMEEMLHHIRAVARARPRALVIGDMPFLSYETSTRDAVLNAGRMLKEGAEAVKIEGGVEVVDKVEAMVKAGIPVMGHVGLTPQRALKLGGYKLMGKKVELAEKIIEDAKALEDAGAFAVVIEFTVAEVARIITEKLSIPTICIGSGPWCDGQVLVIHDILGLSEETPPFAKKYIDLSKIIREAVGSYVKEVRDCIFPSQEHTIFMDENEYKKLVERLKRENL